MKIVISSGHGLHVRGASGIIDEVDEARRVVNQLATLLKDAVVFHDDTSTSKEQNLETIVNFHNSQDRDLDISVHFNAYLATEGERGTEVLYVTQKSLAQKVANAISGATDLIMRGDLGAVKRNDLYFLNNTDMPAILIETCFVDAAGDVEKYQENFEQMCLAIANLVPKAEPAKAVGKVSWFGGPSDTGVAPDEGLAFIYDVSQAPELFLDYQPAGTTDREGYPVSECGDARRILGDPGQRPRELHQSAANERRR